VAACLECLEAFPVDFDDQRMWLEIRKATGGPGVFICPKCANNLGLFLYRPPVLKQASRLRLWWNRFTGRFT
jgi:hypothetical protein